MKALFSNLKALVVMTAAVYPAMASASVDMNVIPGPNDSEHVEYGAYMPYTRYESEDAALDGGAVVKSAVGDVYSDDWQAMQRNIATQASGRKYVELPSNGASVEWTAVRSGNAVTLRFTMPDARTGTDGLRGSLDMYVNGEKRAVYVNGERRDNIKLSSYSMWQYFSAPNGNYAHSHNASDIYIDGAFPAFAFDETGFIVEGGIEQGDVVSIRHNGDGSFAYGIDFLEIEKVEKKECPAGYDRFDGGDLQSFINSHSNIYIPEGTYNVGGKIEFNGKNIKGAGIFHTNIHFTAGWAGGGGIRCGSGELADIHLTSNLNSRMNQGANYKGLEAGPRNLLVHDMWIQHFECGAWFEGCDNVRVISCRLRDNLADGLNFCNGSSNSAVYNCSVRNNGDDGLAIWEFNGYASNDTFCYNTIELGWRAGMVGVFGGNNHRVYNNYIRDAVCSAGIRLTTDFPGVGYEHTDNIYIENNVLVGCGTRHDIFGAETPQYNINGSGRLPAIYVHATDHGLVRNIRFNNNSIYDSQAEDIVIINGDNGNGIVCPNAATPGSEAPGYPEVDDSEEVSDGNDSPYKDLTGYDLQLAGLRWTTAARGSDIDQNDIVEFTYRIRNVGTVDIPDDSKVRISHRLSIDGAGSGSTLSGGLKAGGYKDVTTRWTAKDAGKHTVIASVSVSGLGGEDTGNNSSEEKKINVIEGEREINLSYTKTAGMDLAVTDITWENLSRSDGTIRPGDNIVFTAYAVNSGTEPTPAGTKVGLKFLLDGKDYNDGHITWNDFYQGNNARSFAPDERITLRANGGGQSNHSTDGNIYHSITEGPHSITAFIDDANLIGEANEANNRLTVSLPSIPYRGVEYFADNELSSPDNLDNADTTELIPVTADTDADNRVYDLNGRPIASNPESLPHGIYIVNGKKIIK